MEQKKSLSILEENHAYWTGRAAGYSEVNREELDTQQRERWKSCLQREIRQHFPEEGKRRLRVLDIGTGPGFFAILLCEMGHEVTAIDLTRAMLDEARDNAGPLAQEIRFLEMNAEELAFEDRCFDLVVSRNLTWNLPNPEKAYAEWARVLKKDGLLMNFDANWYAYLFDEEALAGYEQDRVNSEKNGIPDQNIGENFDAMEEIARRIPLSRARRPVWDLKVLGNCGMAGTADEEIYSRVWSEQEKINFASTPLFMVKASKTAAGA